MSGTVTRTTPRRALPLFAATLSAALAIGVALPSNAVAITRPQIIARGMTWVKKQVPYSQARYYRGYRQDCSGFVSMAWNARRSYSTHTLRSVARRIPKSRLRPGDAVVTPSHASLFGGWANRSHTKFIAIEQTNSRTNRPVKRVRNWPRGAVALRYRRVAEPPRRVATRPPAPVTPAVTTLIRLDAQTAAAASATGTASVETSAPLVAETLPAR